MTKHALIPAGPAPAPQDPATKVKREVQALLERTENTKKRKNIERVVSALDDMVARKEKDFSLAQVAKAIERLGFPGPKYQSMRNREGADFRAIIDAYRDVYGRQPSAEGDADSDEDLAHAIPDLRVQQRVRVVLRQLRAMENRNRILHEQIARMGAAAPAAVPAEAATARASSFTPEEIDAVRAFLHRLPSHGLRADEETGCILDARSEREVAPPYFLDALHRIAQPA